ncbi:ubiquinone biosynthesis O-methyltransferase, mitochondrial isoform X2 [Mastomys coucha]|uniref:ubiquinone biosynthesis O-methyltransferase, mitochondrial isoform X2 n=1 Tax=Mastomys coucha TaxID=35658 RepID=UPI0012629CE6|nr:ubiquinone biosynthesis O-methyltransferase, mitochondrial isoform X2 [Mastomys coucha]
MWRGGRLSSRGVLLERLGFGCPGAVAQPPRVASRSAYSQEQPPRNVQVEPWELRERRTMCFRSHRMAFSCFTRVKTFKSPWKRLYSTSQTTIDSKEVKKFQALAHMWWDEYGKFAPLHSMNDLRVPFIRDNLLKTSANHRPGKPLSGMKILDVGCGGGLLTEPLGRLGASVVGIDPVAENIKIAQHHKSFDPVLDVRIQYKVCSLEETAKDNAEVFDAVVASEVLEHVNNLEMFIQCCYQVLKPGGSLFITTINKTQLSYALGIVFSEQIAGIVPKGTHTWEKFVSPEKLESILEPNGLLVEKVAGLVYNPFSGYWHWSESTSLNYAAHAVKSRAQEHQEPAESALKGETEALHANGSASPSVREEQKT